MLRVISSNPDPRIAFLRVRRHATSPVEADEIFADAPEGQVVPVDANHMPYTEQQDEVPEGERPVIKRFRAGDDFRLAVYNFCSDPDVPLVGFSIERIRDGENLYLKGSTRLLDPAKARLTRPAVAAIPLLHVFHAQIRVEAKRASDLIAKASGETNVTSLSGERDKHMMDAALIATHNVMTALYGDSKPQAIKQPPMGQDSLMHGLAPALDADIAFYTALMDKMRNLFEPTIRTLGERVALGGFEEKTAPIRAPQMD